jgi:Cysteine-rich CWC
MSTGGPQCPRCGEAFLCGAASGTCACFGVALNDSLRKQVAASFSDCLCVACLKQLSAADQRLAAQPNPLQK